MSLPRLRLPTRGDLLLAVGVTVLAELDVFAPDLFSTHLTGPRWVLGLVFVLCGVALAWRRLHPLAVFLVVAGALAAHALVFGASEGNGALIPALVATYSVAAHGSRRAAYVALPLAVLLLLVRETHNPSNVDWPATRAALAWDLTVVGAWLTGSWLRARRLYEQALVQRAAQAEHEREQQTRTALAEERARMARELHDSIAHSLTVVVVQAEAAEDALDRDPERARTPIRRIGATGREALLELRQVIGALRGSEAAELAAPRSPSALHDLVDSACSAGLDTHLELTGSPDHVPAATTQTVYRVVQEALTNVMKHSQSRRVRLAVSYGRDWVDLDVQDDGPAAPPSADTPGHGLLGMRERVGLLGGTLVAGPEGSGFRVRARIPAAVAGRTS